MNTPMDVFIKEYNEITDFLIAQNEWSFKSDLDNHYRKILLLSSASYFEQRIQDALKRLAKSKTSSDEIYSLVINKAIERQYYTYFNWKEENKSNINSFLGLFGSEFKTRISNQIKESNELTEAVIAFLEIGRERNQMVHENFLEFNLGKSFEEIVKLNCKAMIFVDFVDNALK